MWRLLGDLWDYWDQVRPAFRRLHDWTPFAGPGHWLDPDMLPLGHLRFLPEGWSKAVTMNRGYFAMVSHGGREDVPNFLTRDEQRTVMTLWTIARCPLMFGGHLPASDAWTMSLIANAEVLAVNQKSRANRQLFHANGLAAWTAESADGKAKYVAVFNMSDRGAHGPEAGIAVPVRLADAGLAGKVAVTDVWSGKAPRRFRGGVRPARPASRRRVVSADSRQMKNGNVSGLEKKGPGLHISRRKIGVCEDLVPSPSTACPPPSGAAPFRVK